MVLTRIRQSLAEARLNQYPLRMAWRARGTPAKVMPWTHGPRVKARVYLEAPGGRVIFCEGLLSHGLNWLQALRADDRLVCLVPCYLDPRWLKIEQVIARRCGIAPARVTVLANTPEQQVQATRMGFDSAWVNHNAFLDENLFRPDTGMNKRFNAVMISNENRIKRPTLAHRVDKLAIISRTPYPPRRLAKFRDVSYYEKIPPGEVLNVLRQSRVGLCLSSREGACYSSSECILAGVPVVSTPSRGGRDHWYTPENHLICEPRPRAVIDAVEKLGARQVDPWRIHAEHCERARPHRRRFIELIDRLGQSIGATFDAEDHFRRTFIHKMSAWRPIDEFREELGRPRG